VVEQVVAERSDQLFDQGKDFDTVVRELRSHVAFYPPVNPTGLTTSNNVRVPHLNLTSSVKNLSDPSYYPMTERTHSRTSQKRRHLPVKDKEKIFNEWGAVYRQIDAATDEQMRKDHEEQKRRKQVFRGELDYLNRVNNAQTAREKEAD
jgi:hypothetical protein